MPEMQSLRLVMMGTGTFAEPTLRALLDANLQVVGLVTQPDREVGSKRGSTRQIGEGMKAIAERHGIPVYQPDSINTPEGVAQLQSWQPDLLVVAAYGQILSDDVLRTAKNGGINVHGSLLPKYRGAAPVAWAILNGDTESGVTIIRMSVSLDAGAMLAKGTVTIEPDETAGELEARLAPLGAQLALDVIAKIANGNVDGELQDQSLVTRAPKLKKEMGLIDWKKTGQQVVNQIRAMQPWPTPYSYLHQTNKTPLRVIIPKAKVVDRTSDVSPGRVILENANQLLVATGNDQVVEILEIQPAGKKRMSALEFLRGRPMHEGDFFGAEN